MSRGSRVKYGWIYLGALSNLVGVVEARMARMEELGVGGRPLTGIERYWSAERSAERIVCGVQNHSLLECSADTARYTSSTKYVGSNRKSAVDPFLCDYVTSIELRPRAGDPQGHPNWKVTDASWPFNHSCSQSYDGKTISFRLRA